MFWKFLAYNCMSGPRLQGWISVRWVLPGFLGSLYLIVPTAHYLWKKHSIFINFYNINEKLSIPYYCSIKNFINFFTILWNAQCLGSKPTYTIRYKNMKLRNLLNKKKSFKIAFMKWKSSQGRRKTEAEAVGKHIVRKRKEKQRSETYDLLQDHPQHSMRVTCRISGVRAGARRKTCSLESCI